MAEGPQVLRRTEWLQRYLAGRTILRAESQREDCPADKLVGSRVEAVTCHGKKIFISLAGGFVLYNHLLMRGKWKKLAGAQLFLPLGAWIGLDVGPYTICNIGGQRLELMDETGRGNQIASLGPDAMATPFPSKEIRDSLSAACLPISELLLDQSRLAGVGNIAKSEILFLARVDPRTPGTELSTHEMARLLEAIPGVLWNSYHAGGRWNCNVYRRDGRPCPNCSAPLSHLSLRPSRRATYFCHRCQARQSRRTADHHHHANDQTLETR